MRPKNRADVERLANWCFWMAATNYTLMIILLYFRSWYAILNVVVGGWNHLTYWTAERWLKEYDRTTQAD